MHLIVPVGGLSARYGVGRPKWLLTHPDGSYMIEKAIDCLPTNEFESINLILTEHVINEFHMGDPESLIATVIAPNYWADKVRVHVLRGRSSCQLETVARAIQELEITGPVMVKDCDNAFTLQAGWKNQGIVTKTVFQNDDIRRLQMKCFAVKNADGLVERLAEKEMASSDFAVGGYVFDDAQTIPLSIDRLRHGLVASGDSSQELYMSHAVNYLRQGGMVFRNHPVTSYEDWGTISEWREYCASFLNVIVDIDGVVFENGSRAMYPRWGQQKPLQANVNALKGLQAGGRTKLIFATARPEKWRDATKVQLEALGLSTVDGLVMGLFHAKRLLVNDFGGVTTPYPSAEAWSVLRNSNQLAEIIAGQRGNSK